MSEAAAPIDDRGLLLGDGLFETLLWSRGALALGPEHGERLIRGAAELGLPPPALADFLAVACEAVARAGLADERAAVRVTLTAGSGGRGLDRPDPVRPRLFAAAAPSPRPAGVASLMISEVRRNAGSPASRLKTLAYLDNVLARAEARRAGADEAAMVSTDGFVVCAAAANLFWVRDRVVFTAPTDAGCLDGIMRGRVLAAAARLGAEVRLVREPPSALADADALFLTSSLIGVRPACWLGGISPPPHALVERLARETAEVS